MATEPSNKNYVLGNSDAEHARLIHQAARLAPLTEAFFRGAGIGPGQRVLDLGSGVGDVAMLAARIVGPTGKVVGIERDAGAIAKARARAAEAGLRHLTFTQSDVADVANAAPFDAAVGRFILMFLPDPVAVLRSVARAVRPGGVLAFQEPCWTVTLAVTAHLALWSASVSLLCQTLRSSGANDEMGLALYAAYQNADLPAPEMRMEMPLGKNPEFLRWLPDTLGSLRPRMQELGLPLETLGPFDTLAERIYAEVAASNTVAGWMGLVGAFAHKTVV